MPLFGVPLAQLLGEGSGSVLVPPFVDQAILHIIRHGLHEEGIFRLSPNKEELEEARRELDKGTRPSRGQEGFDFEERRVDPNVAASLLKIFFRRLDQCLLTTALYYDWIRAGEIEDEAEQVCELRRLVSRLPLVNQAVLERLMFLLAQVSGNEAKNRMGAKSLGLVWGPNVLWLPGGDANPIAAIQRVMESGSVASVVAAMACAYADVFAEHRAAWAESESWAALWRSVVVSHRPLVSLAVATLDGGDHSVWALDTEGTVFVMDPETGSVEGNWRTRQDHTLQLKTIGNHVWGSSYSNLSVWSDNSGVPDKTVPGFNYAMAVVDRTVWTSSDGVLRVWDPAEARVVQEIQQQRGHIALALRKTGEHVWAGGSDRVIRVYSSRTYALVHEWRTDHRKISAFAVCCDRVWSAHEDGTLCVWDPHAFVLERELRLPGVCNVFHIETVGSTVWSCTRDGRIHVWDGRTARHLASAAHCHGDAVTALLPIYNARMGRWQVWTASWDTAVCVWNLNQEMVGMRAPASVLPRHLRRATAPPTASGPAVTPVKSLPTLQKPCILAASTFLQPRAPPASPRSGAGGQCEHIEKPPSLSPRIETTRRSLALRTSDQADEEWRHYGVTVAEPVGNLVMAALLYTRSGAAREPLVEWLQQRGIAVCGDLVEASQEAWAELEAFMGGAIARAFYRVVKHLRPGKKVYLRRHPRHGGRLEHHRRMSCAEWAAYTGAAGADPHRVEAAARSQSMPTSLKCSYNVAVYDGVSKGKPSVTWTLDGKEVSGGINANELKLGSRITCTVTPVDSLGAVGLPVTSPVEVVVGFVQALDRWPAGSAVIPAGHQTVILIPNTVPQMPGIQRERCRSLGGDIGPLSDEANTLVAHKLSVNSRALIGLSSPAVGVAYKWVDGTSLQTSKFSQTPRGGQFIAVTKSGSWDEVACDTLVDFYVCVVNNTRLTGSFDISARYLVYRPRQYTSDEAADECRNVFKGHLSRVLGQSDVSEFQSILTRVGLRSAHVEPGRWSTVWSQDIVQNSDAALVSSERKTSLVAVQRDHRASAFFCDIAVLGAVVDQSSVVLSRIAGLPDIIANRFGFQVSDMSDSYLPPQAIEGLAPGRL
eukprot:m51a1_g8615 putative domain-containing protein (1106) ;mRNA; f:23490-29594